MPILKPETFEVSLLPDVDEQKALVMKNSDENQLVALYTGDDSAEEAGGSFDKEIVVRKVRLSERVMGYVNIYPSPDGRYLSFANWENGNMAILDLTTGESRDINDEGYWGRIERYAISSTWSPDGKSIVFASNRTPDGAVGLWLMQIVDGKPAGDTQLVKKEVGDIRTLGFTEKGSLFYTTMTSWSDIYVTSVDMETGELTSTPELLPSQGFNTTPTWSPDGESLAYESQRTAPGSFRIRPVLVIRSMRTGEERELIPDQDIATWGTLGQLRWSPDGRSILCGGHPGENLHLIDVQTGHVTANVAIRKGGPISGPAWSPDGKTILFTRMRLEKEDWPCRIVALNLETRKERELYASGRRAGPLAVSPDGRQLAFSGEGQLKVIPTAGGEPRTLVRKDPNLRDTDFFGAPIAWTPDGRYVLFIIGKSPSDEQPDGMVQLWRVPAEGGIPQKVLEMEGEETYLSLHPDGWRIAFQKGKRKQVDLWVMENLLPESTASR